MPADLISSINKNTLSIEDLIALRMIFNSNDAVYKFISAGLSIKDIFSLTYDDLKVVFRFRYPEDIINKLKNYDQYEEDVEEVMIWCEEHQVQIISFFDDLYPESIKEIVNPSCLIFCAGNTDLLNYKNSITIVGTRKCSKYGEKIAAGVSKFFSSNDINIVSGLAIGIDTIAHEQSLQFNGKTTSILIDLKQISPPKNRNLARKIVESGGLLIAENIPGTLPEKYHYVARNRLQAALSRGIFIIEASLNSGTNSTAEFALSQNKKIYCPDYSCIKGYPAMSEVSELPQRLILDGHAESFTKDNYDQILEFLNSDTTSN